MSLEEYLEKSDQEGLKALLLWCIKEHHGENSRLYGIYQENIDKFPVNKMKVIIEASTMDMVPEVVNDIINVYAGLFCKK